MKSQKFKTYYDSVAYLESLQNVSSPYQKTNLRSHPHPEIFLKRVQEFLDRIGNPEFGFKFVHITGTSGKGSVSAMVHATLVARGKKSGLFTSPFTVSTIEKIQVNDLYIDPMSFAKIVKHLKPHIDEAALRGKYGMPSYFELLFVIAMIYFKQQKCEYVVLEVGLGGRYDVTNVIKNPLITAITNIDLDHTQILGKTKALIAADKSGIIKQNCSFITTEEDLKILTIFRNTCRTFDAVFTPIDVRDKRYSERNRLLAGHICEQLGIIKNVSEVETAFMPARFETLQNKPRVVIDGAHNPAKISAMIENLRKLKYSRLILIFGISSDKDWRKVLKLIVPKSSKIYMTRFTSLVRKAANLRELVRTARRIGKFEQDVTVCADPVEALRSALKDSGKNDLILVTGSFYLAGEIRKQYQSEESILRLRRSLNLNYHEK